MTLAEEKEIETSATPSPRESISQERKVEPDNTAKENDDGSIKNTPPVAADEDEGEYPDATRMAFIVVALLLSIFLVRPRFNPCLRSRR